MIIFLTKDLFFVPLLKSAAEKLNCSILSIPNLTSPRLGELDASEVSAGVVDLTAVPIGDISLVAQSFRERFPQIQLAAFGPHVHDAHLEAAQAAGFQDVLTRGQLNANIGRYMEKWSKTAPSRDSGHRNSEQ
jgi:hypothetical protein